MASCSRDEECPGRGRGYFSPVLEVVGRRVQAVCTVALSGVRGQEVAEEIVDLRASASAVEPSGCLGKLGLIPFFFSCGRHTICCISFFLEFFYSYSYTIGFFVTIYIGCTIIS